MMTSYRMITAVLLLLSAVVTSCNDTESKTVSQQQQPVPPTITVDTAPFQNIVDSIYQANPASIGIMVHIESPRHNVSWSGGVGYSDNDNQTPLTPDQPALIASSIKTYVAATILRLQEEGLLNIEDPIDRHLTKETVALFTNDGYAFDQIKIKHLLSHTSGIADYVDHDYMEFIDQNQQYRWTRRDQLIRSTEVGDPLGEPQELFQYADVNFLLATEIMEEVTGKPFYTVMREFLKYDELNLTTTWFPTLEDQPAGTPELIHQYWHENDLGPNTVDFAWDSHQHDISWDLYGGGGIATNMEELAQFSHHLFSGKIIQDQQVLDLLMTDVTTTDGVPKIYRLGVADAKVKGLRSYGHGGFWGTMVFYLPQLDASISVSVSERFGKMKVIRSTLDALVTALTQQLHPSQHVVVAEQYQLYNVNDSKATLILYPGGGTTSVQTKEEFDILTAAAAHDIDVVLMDFNRHLWIDDSTTQQLAEDLNTLIATHKLNTDKVFIGGMSIGGNVALTLSNYLHEIESSIAPEGTFIVDSPIDLYALYQSAQQDLANPDFDEERLAEPRWIVSYFNEEFTKDSIVTNIQQVSPFTQATNFINVSQLQGHKLRFYTEPDSTWWKENRGTAFENTNAYAIQQVAAHLNANNWHQFELIETQGKGVRANGEKHPHSWSIVDVNDLIFWMLE